MSLSFYAEHFGLDGKSAVVLGGSTLPGRAVAEALGRAGAVCVIAGRSEARGHGCVERIRSTAGQAGFWRTDLSSAESVEQLLDYAVGEHGQVDLLVQIAAPTWDSAWMTAVERVFQRQLQRQPEGGVMLGIVPHEFGEEVPEPLGLENVARHRCVARFEQSLWQSADASRQALRPCVALLLGLLAAGPSLADGRWLWSSPHQAS